MHQLSFLGEEFQLQINLSTYLTYVIVHLVTNGAPRVYRGEYTWQQMVPLTVKSQYAGEGSRKNVQLVSQGIKGSA